MRRILSGLLFLSLVSGCGKRAGEGHTSSGYGLIGSPSTLELKGHLVMSGVDKRPTHVVAIDPADGSRNAVALDGEARFSLPLTKGHAALIVFADATKHGLDMLAGRLRVAGLEVLPVGENASDSLDLGDVNADEGMAGDAVSALKPTTSYSEVLKALGLTDAQAATFLGAGDEALRYVNPDVEGHIDSSVATLTLQSRMESRASGAVLALSDVKNRYSPLPTTLTSAGATIAMTLNSPGEVPTTFGLVFDEDVNLADGSTLPAGESVTPNLDAGAAPTDKLRFSLDVHRLPEGEYELTAGKERLSFASVRAPRLHRGFLLYTVKLTVKDDGSLGGLAWKWYSRDRKGAWLAASDADVRLWVRPESAKVSFASEQGRQVSWTLPLQAEGELGYEAADTDGDLHFGQLLSHHFSYENVLGSTFTY